MIPILQVMNCPEHGRILSDECEVTGHGLDLQQIHKGCGQQVFAVLKNGRPSWQRVDKERFLRAIGKNEIHLEMIE